MPLSQVSWREPRLETFPLSPVPWLSLPPCLHRAPGLGTPGAGSGCCPQPGWGEVSKATSCLASSTTHIPRPLASLPSSRRPVKCRPHAPAQSIGPGARLCGGLRWTVACDIGSFSPWLWARVARAGCTLEGHSALCLDSHTLRSKALVLANWFRSGSWKVPSSATRSPCPSGP